MPSRETDAPAITVSPPELQQQSSQHQNGHAHKKESNTAAQQQLSSQAERLAQYKPSHETSDTGNTQAVQAKFVTPLDPVIETANGGRLPVVPIHEAEKLNDLKADVEGEDPVELKKSNSNHPVRDGPLRTGKDGSQYGVIRVRKTRGEGGSGGVEGERQSDSAGAPLREAIPPSRTHPLFPPLPMYGPPSLMRWVQCWIFRTTSWFLSLGFLIMIFMGAIIGSMPRIIQNSRRRAMLQNPLKQRPFYDEEMKRRQERRAADKAWTQLQKKRKQKKEKEATTSEKASDEKISGNGESPPQDADFVPTEGGPDPLILDVGYYARRVGLDAETYEVQTEDGYIIELWHIFNPREYERPPASKLQHQGPDVFENLKNQTGYGKGQHFRDGNKKYPVLMIHGLLQASGAFCSNDDDSLAFYLAKSGYDVWLGNNRCGFAPKHTMLEYNDPRMWAWNIRQMGVMDLPALVSRVLAETGFPKLALIAHSQGTTQTFVALAKEQRPDLGEKISVFCALAPAVYAGPLIGKLYFKIMRLISPAVFRIIFGIHAFIPFMAFCHAVIPPKPYSFMAYHVFSHLFGWSDTRWERALRNRGFQWAPTFVSAESMRWWLGRECFATQKCILATREEGAIEDKEDEEDDEIIRKAYVDREPHVSERRKLQRNLSSFHCARLEHLHHDSTRGKFAWYNSQFPPLALWVCGADNLVDGRRLLRRFDRGREPHVRVVHKKLIDGYEHLDVIWAMDAIEKVGKEVREVIWRTVEPGAARVCRTPVGCHLPLEQTPPLEADVPMLNSGGRLRMASISEGGPGATGGNAGPPNIEELLRGKPGRKSETEFEAAPEAEWEHEGLEDEEEELGIKRFDEEEKSGERRFSEVGFTDLQEKGNPLG